MVRLIALFVVMVVVSTSVGCSDGGVDFTEHNDTNCTCHPIPCEARRTRSN